MSTRFRVQGKKPYESDRLELIWHQIEMWHIGNVPEKRYGALDGSKRLSKRFGRIFSELASEFAKNVRALRREHAIHEGVSGKRTKSLSRYLVTK